MATTVEQRPFTGNDYGTRQTLSQTQRMARHAFRIINVVFLSGIATQFLIVGMALFVDGSRWNLHQMVGHALAIAPLLMLVSALIGRMSLTVRLLSPLLLGLVIMQQVTVSIGDWAAAVHPLNALLMFGIGISVLRRTAAELSDSPGA